MGAFGGGMCACGHVRSEHRGDGLGACVYVGRVHGTGIVTSPVRCACERYARASGTDEEIKRGWPELAGASERAAELERFAGQTWQLADALRSLGHGQRVVLVGTAHELGNVELEQALQQFFVAVGAPR